VTPERFVVVQAARLQRMQASRLHHDKPAADFR